jgi:hypothetical protein
MRMLNKMVASIITIDSSIGLIKGLDSFYILKLSIGIVILSRRVQYKIFRWCLAQLFMRGSSRGAGTILEKP